MIKKITCIECPKGCCLSAQVNEGTVIEVIGNACQKGELYARNEINDPKRILTTTVLGKGLSLSLIPVRTDKPISKAKITEVIAFLNKFCLEKPVNCGDILVDDVLGLGANIIATRSIQ
jgi:CxxC motif-containing protein